jgi:hypothetical protein
VGSSNIYESEDGNYTQLDATNASAPVVRTSDGTQLSFMPVTINSEFRCVQGERSEWQFSFGNL